MIRLLFGILLTFVEVCANKSVLVVSTTFLSNLGVRRFVPLCDESCVHNILWDNQTNINDYFMDNSDDAFSLNVSNTLFITVDLPIRASYLGCTLDIYKANIYSALSYQNISVNSYDFQIVLLPFNAGGGACARAPYYVPEHCFGRGTFCPIYIRTSNNLDWLQSMSIVMGGKLNNDTSDGINGGWTRLSTYNRFLMNFLSNNTNHNLPRKTTETTIFKLTSSSRSDSTTSDKLMISYNGTFVSYRTCNDETYDIYLPNCPQVYIHDTNANLKTTLLLGQTYTNYIIDLVFSVSEMNSHYTTLSINFCNSQPLQPKLLTTSIISYPPTSDANVSLQVTNPSAFCAPKTQTFKLDDIGTMPQICNVVAIAWTTNFYRPNLAYRMLSSDDTVVMEGRYENNQTLYCGYYNEILTIEMTDNNLDGMCQFYASSSVYKITMNNELVMENGVCGRTFEQVFFLNALFWRCTDLPSGVTQIYDVVMPTFSDFETTHLLQLDTVYPSPSTSQTSSPSYTPSISSSTQQTVTPTSSVTNSFTSSATNSLSETSTTSPSSTATISSSGTVTSSPSGTTTSSPSESASESTTKSISYTKSISNSKSMTKSISYTKSISNSKSTTKSISYTKSTSKSKSTTKSVSYTKSISHSKMTKSKSVPKK